MGRWLRNAIYGAICVIAVPFVLWRFVRHGKRTPALFEKLTGRIEIEPKRSMRVWIHAVSVGEVLQVRPLIRELQSVGPNTEIVLSTTTAAGLKVAREKYRDCQIVPFPFDFSWAVANAFSRIRPDTVVLIELELWPNFISEARRRNVPLVVANGRLSEKSSRGYGKFVWAVRPMFEGLSKVCAQSECYAERFRKLGVSDEALSVTGSIKFDSLRTDRSQPDTQSLRTAFGFSENDLVLMAGSTHDPEESIVLGAWQQLKETHRSLKLLLVPRHPERFDAVDQLCRDLGHGVWRRSAATTDSSSHAVRLLDTVGELSACWGLADYAFVGGTLCRRGGQNMLEPAAFGTPVVLGPNVWNFADIAAGLSQAGGSITVTDVDTLVEVMSHLLSDKSYRSNVANAAKEFAASQSGAAKETAAAVMDCLRSVAPQTAINKRAA